MRLKTLVNKALKEHPIHANTESVSEAAIIFLDADEGVYSLKVNMSEERFRQICDHIAVHGVRRVVSRKIVFEA